MNGNRIVYITGVTGSIGQLLARSLRDRYVLRGNSRRGGVIDGVEVAQGDVADEAFMKMQLNGVDTVIHLAGEPRSDAGWEDVLKNNIEGTYHLFEAAKDRGVRRVIFASTNHVTGILTERVVDMGVDAPFRPDGFYGVSKAFGEVLGRYYSDRFNMSVLNYRIGWYFADKSHDEIVAILQERRDAYPLMWLSPGDCVRAFEAGIEADPLLQVGTYYIMSNNRDGLWNMRNAKDELGYEPQDDLGRLFDGRGITYNFRIPSNELGG